MKDLPIFLTDTPQVFVWVEQRGVIILGTMKQVESYGASFVFPSFALFQEVPRGLVFFGKYQSHDSGEMPFSFAQIESFLPLVHVNICFPHHDIFSV